MCTLAQTPVVPAPWALDDPSVECNALMRVTVELTGMKQSQPRKLEAKVVPQIEDWVKIGVRNLGATRDKRW